jgi:hypothetical protein
MSLSADIRRQGRVTRPTAKLVDINNGEKAPLPFQRAAIAAAAAAETARLEALKAHTASAAPAPVPPSSSPGPSFPPSSPATSGLTPQASFNTEATSSDREDELPIPGGSKCHILISDDESSVEDSGKLKKKQKSKGNSM